MTQSVWGDETIRRIAESIRSARGKRSVQWVADRTAELGHPMSRSAISNLEVGRKAGVDITELIILARALEVAPMMLIYPDLMDGAVEVVPGQIVTTFEAHKWFAGEWVPNPAAFPAKPAPEEEGSRLPEHENWRYLDSVRPVDLARGYHTEKSRLDALKDLIAKSDGDHSEFADLLSDRQKRVAEIRRMMGEQGMVLNDE